MTDDAIAAMQAIIDGRDRHIATLEDEIFILKRQLAEGIRARRVTMDEYMEYTGKLEFLNGRMVSNGVDVFVAAEEDFQKVKDAIEDYNKGLSFEERLALEDERARLKPKKVIMGRDEQLAERDAEIANLKRQLAEGIRARRVSKDEYLNYTRGLEYIDGRMKMKNGVEVFVAESEDFQRQKDAVAEWNKRLQARRDGKEDENLTGHELHASGRLALPVPRRRLKDCPAPQSHA